MITTRRQVNIDNGATQLRTHTVQRISDTSTVSVNPTVEVNNNPVQTYTVITRREPHRDANELMPTITTEKKAVSEKNAVDKLSSKTKAMLCIYAAAAVVLALIVMFTGLAITRTGGEVADLEGQLSAMTVQLSDAQSSLAHYSDDVTITGSATEMGMVKAENPIAIETISMGEKTSYEARTNAFDKVCDFISKLVA